MASGLKLKDFNINRGPRVPSHNRPKPSTNRTTKPRSKWQLNLNLFQLVVAWSLIIGSMVMVFLFGFYAGREQGVQAALKDHKVQTVRFKIQQEDPIEQSNSIASSKLNSNNPLELLGAMTNSNPRKQPKVIKAGEGAVAIVNEDFYVQISAKASKNEAEKVLLQAKRSSYDGKIETANVRKVTYYRVLLGPYSSRADALKAEQEIVKLRLADSKPFIKKIKN